jgi:hypothetical protein
MWGLMGNSYGIRRAKKSDRFRIMTGYKFVKVTYPYGSDMRLFPYIPMMEKMGSHY